MNCRIYLVYFLMISCSSNQLSEKKYSFKQKHVIKKIAISKQCENKIKSLAYLSRFQQGDQSIKRVSQKNIQELCSKNLKKAEDPLGFHENSIGILYESNDHNQLQSKAILEGLLTLNKSVYVIEKSKRVKKDIDKALSTLIIKNKVGLIISWGSQKFTNYIKKWQDKLEVPTIFIGSHLDGIDNTFKVFPNVKNYGMELVRAMKKKGVKKLAFLTPSHSESSHFLKEIKDQISESGIKITYDQIYDPENYDSMDMACRSIFEINRNTRWEEYSQILLSEKRKANAEGYELNKKLVFLPARVTYDAIFIPDNFKIVNHFVKIFEYYKMPKLSLFGTHEWRSSDLTKLDSEYLSGATFVDFIGNQSQLPKEFNQPLGLNTDYKLMGFYAAQLGHMAIKVSKKRKYLVSKALKEMRLNDSFFNNNKAFIQNEFNWPSFSFEIQNGQIELSEK